MVIQVAVSRGFNGIGLAIVIPSIQSLAADLTDEINRGTAFMWLQVTGSMGSIIGGLFSVLPASTSFMGIPSWRIDFHLVAFVSVIVGVLVHLFANDPRLDDDNVAQGVAGSFPWNALSFAPMRLELIGFSYKKVAFLWTLFSIAVSLGGLFGGKMGDILGQRYPNSGWIILSQISSGLAIPLAAILLLVLPDDPLFLPQHSFMGLSC
ncbi:hypothetical protein RHMOL_Rhmol10G0239500 [Rhododendron molle]|uniref:Uncharacterized protein n=1 Tax=Rhododendron molle TaxID=49168 RepID=A0ACC0M5A6_RHOML|nr:hypothetical protein RHMOL_Rhmol10G0239500 [Rhododendron molle]